MSRNKAWRRWRCASWDNNSNNMFLVFVKAKLFGLCSRGFLCSSVTNVAVFSVFGFFENIHGFFFFLNFLSAATRKWSYGDEKRADVRTLENTWGRCRCTECKHFSYLTGLCWCSSEDVSLCMWRMVSSSLLFSLLRASIFIYNICQWWYWTTTLFQK